MMPEEKLKSLLNFYWKGFREYDELPQHEKISFQKLYSIEELFTIIKGAYNIGIETAAENAHTLQLPVIENESPEILVDTRKILKLKI